jgi:hypothetical protein
VRGAICENPSEFLGDWIALYDGLIRRHKIRGVAAFSEDSFALQMMVPGLRVFRATAGGETVGMLLWFLIGDIAYYHLGAYSDAGYRLRASYALFSDSIDYFADAGIGWLNLGAGAGTRATEADGLSRFKRGWSSGTRTAYFCGRIFDPERYREMISRQSGMPGTGFFPAYRHGEY